MPGKVVIQIEHLRKVYGSTVAVDAVTFEVLEGEIFGMVGPNGAGKTTTTECIEGLRDPDAGSIQVLGASPQKKAMRYASASAYNCKPRPCRSVLKSGKRSLSSLHFIPIPPIAISCSNKWDWPKNATRNAGLTPYKFSHLKLQ